MRAIIARDRAAGIGGLSLAEVSHPHAAENDVIVRVHAAGFTPGELDWPGTWTDRAGRDRSPTIPGHELSGVVAELGYGTTGLTVGQRVFGVTDWTRNGTLAEYVAVEARNLAPLSAGIDHTVAAALPISGLTAWQGLFDHGHLVTGQTVLIHGAAGAVGSIAVQLAREAGARVIGSGRTAQRETVLGLHADAFLDMQRDRLEEVGEVDMDAQSFSWWNPIAPVWPRWNAGFGTDGCTRSSERSVHSPRRSRHSTRPIALAARRSSESLMTRSRREASIKLTRRRR